MVSVILTWKRTITFHHPQCQQNCPTLKNLTKMMEENVVREDRMKRILSKLLLCTRLERNQKLRCRIWCRLDSVAAKTYLQSIPLENKISIFIPRNQDEKKPARFSIKIQVWSILIFLQPIRSNLKPWFQNLQILLQLTHPNNHFQISW